MDAKIKPVFSDDTRIGNALLKEPKKKKKRIEILSVGQT